ncbi:PSME3-interacting protein [Condylostylus longicornis]|uniref:PSME3-interacting protein n=1 Tax=Condylostylus longicornis TaxID=2530218 RepID=UPI00244DA784|nr:PSME3-interacting protein [Condylostylus longicornis]
MSSKFITEAEIVEMKKKRQEEWEKVRNCDDPVEAPEEPYDSRSLYEKLKEQKMKKDLEYEEAHKLKNLIRGLDDDEVHFLDLVSKQKYENEKKQQLEVEKELEDYRKQVAALQEKTNQKRIENMNSKPNSKIVKTKSTQKSLMSGIIRKPSGTCETSKTNNAQNSDMETKKIAQKRKPENDIEKTTANMANTADKGALKCIAILPGIGRYKESSDSEMSSDSDEEISNEKYDLCGRKKQKKCEQEQE